MANFVEIGTNPPALEVLEAPLSPSSCAACAFRWSDHSGNDQPWTQWQRQPSSMQEFLQKFRPKNDSKAQFIQGELCAFSRASIRDPAEVFFSDPQTCLGMSASICFCDRASTVHFGHPTSPRIALQLQQYQTILIHLYSTVLLEAKTPDGFTRLPEGPCLRLPTAWTSPSDFVWLIILSMTRLHWCPCFQRAIQGSLAETNECSAIIDHRGSAARLHLICQYLLMLTRGWHGMGQITAPTTHLRWEKPHLRQSK